MNNKDSNKRVFINTIALSGRMLITMFLGIYTSRIVLQNLGIEDYGIYNVVGGIVSMFTFMNTSLLDASQRYLNFYLGKQDTESVNRVFCTSINIFFVIALVIALLVEVVGVWFLHNKLNIPVDRMNAANWLLQFTVVGSFVSISSTPYNALIVAYEKMTTFAYVSIFQSIATFLIAYCLCWLPGDKLIVYGLLMVTIQLLVRLYYRLYCSSTFPNVKYHLSLDKPMLKNMFSFSAWTATSTFAYMTYTQGITMLINVFFGPALNAAHALAQQINGTIVQFSKNFEVASKPQIVKNYASGNLKDMNGLVFLSTKVSFVIMLVISLPVLFHTDFILSLWLTEVPNYTSDIVRLILINALLSTFAGPIITAVQATGNIRNFQLSITLTNLMILPIAYLVVKTTNQIQYIYIVLIVMTIFVQFVRLFYYQKQLNLSLREYFKDVVFRLLIMFICCVGVIQLYEYYYRVESVIGLFFCLVFVFILVFFVSFGVVLKSTERKMIINLVSKKIKKRD